ncbi:GNAT family N-acetyltransferase [Caballeronia sp. M1242]|uniref:GNAT family N-acetyltransferase n=1 Tax=Caballeronia sp. M1242 TaxID=2814653 RepID=UPI0019D15892|nr:GNAT family protein [Caballeronia sp. M1242]QSN64141.1 GNAT family N-acetyltransferase [Caballeronia sp. M1242]
MLVRQLTRFDASSFVSLRLAGLKECPASFASSYEEEAGRSLHDVEKQLAAERGEGVFGSFDETRLVGVAGLGREHPRKLSHKAFVWGVYVAPEMRGRGISRALIVELIRFAQLRSDITQINLTVNAKNELALRLYKSLGFEPFGIERNSLLVDGCFHDEVHMSLQMDRRTAS